MGSGKNPGNSRLIPGVSQDYTLGISIYFITNSIIQVTTNTYTNDSCIYVLTPTKMDNIEKIWLAVYLLP